MSRKAVGFRLTPEGDRRLRELAARFGVSQSAVVEMAVRRLGEVYDESLKVERDVEPWKVVVE